MRRRAEIQKCPQKHYAINLLSLSLTDTVFPLDLPLLICMKIAHNQNDVICTLLQHCNNVVLPSFYICQVVLFTLLKFHLSSFIFIPFLLVQGKFLLGTPRTCQSPLQPEHGRWVCSYEKGENGRSLCILDCKKNFIIEDRPLIFNCANGDWEMFPTPGTPVNVPWGNCIPVELYKARFSNGAVTEKRSEAITERGSLLELEDFIDSL